MTKMLIGNINQLTTNGESTDEKSVYVLLRGRDVPLFTFKGVWTGKDVRTVTSHIHRAYLLKNKLLRREILATKGE